MLPKLIVTLTPALATMSRVSGAETTSLSFSNPDSRLIDCQPASRLHLIHASFPNEAHQLRHEQPAGGQTRFAAVARKTLLRTMLSRLDRHSASIIVHDGWEVLRKRVETLNHAPMISQAPLRRRL